MPAPAKIRLDAVVLAGRRVLEQGGVDGLTMQAVAESLGVRAPSLYKHVTDRDDLLARVRAATLIDLAALLHAVDVGEPRERIIALASALRAFAAQWPAGKALAFSRGEGSAERALLARTVEPLLVACRSLVGARDALDAARTVTAWLHGFSDMERAGAFELGGDVDASFAYGIRTLVASLSPR